MCVCVCTCVNENGSAHMSALGGRKRVSYPLELELQVTVTRPASVLRTKLRFCKNSTSS